MDSPVSPDNVAENKALIHRFYGEVWNQKTLDLLPEVLSPAFRWHEPYKTEDITDFEGAIAFLKMLFTAFPDYTIQIEDLFGESDRVAVRWLGNGTHLGELKGIQPTGRAVSIPGMSIFCIEAGRITEYWTSLDSLLVMAEIGAFDSGN
ncbi:MAG: ester cyclase [Cyanobacteria bacterium J06638_22]